MLTRLFVFHIGALPTIMVVVLMAHLLLMRAHGVSELGSPAKKDAERFPFIPDHLLTEIGIAMFLMFIVTFLAIVFPVSMGPKADPLNTPEHIKPEWYFVFVYVALKIMPMHVGMSVLMVLGLVLVLWPFIDEFLGKRIPKFKFHYVVGAVAILTFLTVTAWELLL